MALREILNLVWINICGNKSKVLLTSLGIIVGAATIVIVIAIGLGGQKDVQDQFKNLNAGTVTIADNSGSASGSGGFGSGTFSAIMGSFSGGGMSSGNRGGSSGNRTPSGFPSGGMMPSFPGMMGGVQQIKKTTFTETDVEELMWFIPNIETITLMVNTSSSVEGGTLEEELTSTIVGVTDDYVAISNLELMFGAFFTDEDNAYLERVVVLGYQAAVDIFGNVFDAYGSQININNKKYDVIGILTETGSTVSGITLDNALFVPYNSAVKYVAGSNASPKMIAIVDDINEMETTISDIQTLLTEMYPKGSFSVTDSGSQVAASQASANTMSILLIAVASVVFVVGGIGIMNVLFVSVKERTREIGILKALGSSRKDILLQFLLEANIISVFGGIVGVIVGYLLMPVVRLSGMSVVASTSASIIALLFAVFTGTVFGFYPAWQAACLKPIDALNHE
ncbi:MAG: ABC transporter permease [Peptococcaceae bacterium]|nr:ABC transporter permease [Peptococcaceae bacterium]